MSTVTDAVTKNGAHSEIGASSMYRWGVCPGSVRQSRGIPNKSSKYALEGTDAHTLAAALLAARLGLESETLQKLLKQKEVFTDEMLEAVEVYVNTILEDGAAKPGVEVRIEHRFDLTRIHPGLFGTADCVVFYPKEQLLRIYDYKHGAGLSVDVENNEQLQYYGLGALLTTEFKAVKVELVIVQPRCAHHDGMIRRWGFDALDMLDFSATLKEKAKATEAPNAPLVSGEHCRFCPAAPTCPKLHEQANEAALATFGELSAKPIDLATALGMLDALEAFVKTVREAGYNAAMEGNTPQGWKLVAKRASRKWRNETECGTYFRSMQSDPIFKGLEFFEAPSLKSVPAIEKLLPKDHRGILKDLCVSLSSGFTLVPVSDPRPEVKRDAISEFSEKVPELPDPFS